MKIIEPHHDGSPLYVSNAAPEICEKVTLSVRVPRDFPLDEIQLRIYHDGEARFFPLKEDKKITGGGDRWWRVKVEMMNPQNSYRFLILSNREPSWLTAAGIKEHEPNSNTDFVILAAPAYPSWISKTVFYQIFPDRFATSGKSRTLPDWAVPRSWNLAPNGDSKQTGQEFYGGDFAGAKAHLSHIEELGATGIYFTPIFPASSSHRYDAISFDHVDPLLGGDKEFVSFLQATRKRKIKVIIDLTTNHVGVNHSWFKKAKSNKSSPERKFFFWDKSISFGYVGWFGLASLPKLNFTSQVLRNRLYKSKGSALQKWLRPPFSLDGWRIDVGNMTGRYRETDLHDEVVHEIREVMDQVSPNSWLVAENADMIARDLDGSGWHGTMNYQGFARPMWGWINHNPNVRPGGQGMSGDVPVISTKQFIQTLREFNGGIPWRSLLASMNLLDSHDTARMRNIVGGDRDRHIAAMTLLLTYPGVPSIYQGDEIGIEGAWGEDARKPMPWQSPESWDHEFFEATKRLVALRTSVAALADGGLRFIAIEKDYFIFLRELKSETIFVVISRVPLSGTASALMAPATYGLVASKALFESQHSQIWACSAAQ